MRRIACLVAPLFLALGCEGELSFAEPARQGDAGAGVVVTVDAGPEPVADPDAGPPGGGGDPDCARTRELRVIALANQARSEDGLGELRCDATMVVVARDHSRDMCEQGYFSHTGLDGRSPFDRMTEGGVRYRTAGENIAYGYETPGQVHEGWMNSPGHRANILRGSFGRIGVGHVLCDGRNFWTQVFAD